MSSNDIYCVYLTFYKGNKLPPFYIGYTSVRRVENGYHGSVTSKKYSAIWKLELQVHPELFKTIILCTHHSKEEAKLKETKLQLLLNVVRSPLYINMGVARPGGFSTGLVGEDHPMYGKTGAKHPCYGIKRRPRTQAEKDHISRVHKGKPKSEGHRRKMRERALNRPEEHNRRISEGLLKGNHWLRGKEIPVKLKKKLSEAIERSWQDTDIAQRRTEGIYRAIEEGKMIWDDVRREHYSTITSGGKNPMAKSVTIDGITYATKKDAMASLGLTLYQVNKRSGNPCHRNRGR